MEQEVKDKTSKPQGLMPKNLQALIIAGIALVMIVIMALTGRKAPAPVTAPAAPPPPSPVDQARILSFRHDIQQQQADSATKLDTLGLSDILYLAFVFIDILALFRRIQVDKSRVESREVTNRRHPTGPLELASLFLNSSTPQLLDCLLS